MTITYYAISDIHGHVNALYAALDHVPLEKDPETRLILLGDYVSRGPASCEVLTLVRDLHQRYPGRVIALLGNHDMWLLEWLHSPDDDDHWWLLTGGFDTIRSFIPDEDLADILGHGDLDGPLFNVRPASVVNRELKRAMQVHHGDLLRWLRALPLVHETETHIWVHAGVDESAGEFWCSATPDHVFTEKYPPSIGRHDLGKNVVAGHVRTSELHGDPDKHSVFSDGGYHLYIDGGVERTGKLNLLRVNGATGEWSEVSMGAND